MTVSRLSRSVARCAAVLTLGVAACGGQSADVGEKHPERPTKARHEPVAAEDDGAPAGCSASHRRGDYQVEVQPFSSTCPALPDSVEHWDGKAPPLPKSCTSDTPDHWSQDGCTLERAYTCREEDGSTTRTALTSSQKNQDGSVLSGMMSIRKYDKEDSPICQGTYSFTSSRE